MDDIADMSDIAQVKTIVLSPAAAKALDKLPEWIRARIADALHAYAIACKGDFKVMAGTPTARLGDGDYRVIFDETTTTITVLAVGHRREIYR